jgi:hypothetical protein
MADTPPPEASFVVVRNPSPSFEEAAKNGVKMRVIPIDTFARLRHNPADS